jgi:hypothetical protein
MQKAKDWIHRSATVLFESLTREEDFSEDEKLLLNNYAIDPRIYGRLVFFLDAYSIIPGINRWGSQTGRMTDEQDLITAYSGIWNDLRQIDVSMFDECKQHLTLYLASSRNAEREGDAALLGIRKAFGQLLGAYHELREEPTLLLPYGERYFVEKIRFTVSTLNTLAP